MLFEVDEKDLMRPTEEWLRLNYVKLNHAYFNDELGYCALGVFTNGIGSNGNLLGWFSMDTKNPLFYQKGGDRQMYYKQFDGTKIFIDRFNFVYYCHPTIKLNGNYRATEKSLLSTLLHEMCHYYTYMFGYIPKQAHGVEFKRIASIVSAKSKGLFPVERLASDEEMQETVLDSKYQKINDKRLENKKNKIIPTFIFMNNGEIRLVMSNSGDLVLNIANEERGKGIVKICKNRELIDFLFDEGFDSTCRLYRFWNIENEPWIKKLDNYDLKEV